MLGLSATFIISHLAFHFVADADHMACRLGTPRTAGRSSLIFIRCRVVKYFLQRVSYISGHVLTDGASVYQHCAACSLYSTVKDYIPDSSVRLRHGYNSSVCLRHCYDSSVRLRHGYDSSVRLRHGYDRCLHAIVVANFSVVRQYLF